MKKQLKYRILIHCKLQLLREGFNLILRDIGLPIVVQYDDLVLDGILYKLDFAPHLIILLLNESDSDFTLPTKIRLFASDIPVLIITPATPKNYLRFLYKIGIKDVIELPIDNKLICEKIIDMLE